MFRWPVTGHNDGPMPPGLDHQASEASVIVLWRVALDTVMGPQVKSTNEI